jgi:hypothetical protein
MVNDVNHESFLFKTHSLFQKLYEGIKQFDNKEFIHY